jgi:protein-disulfide isomerase
VTIVEFADFRCPFCTRSQPLLQQVLHLYEGRVRLLFKHFPLSSHAPMAEDAALAALAAQKQDAFWGMHDRLFGERAALDPPSLVEAARQLGLDVERFRRDLEDPGLKARLEADIADGRAADLTGTPTFYVNGRKLQRVSLSGFRQAIEQALADSSGGAGKR